MVKNRKDIISQLSERGYTKKDAAMLIDDLLDVITTNLSAGDSVFFFGFGTFSAHCQKPHYIMDNFTGQKKFLSEHFVPKFSAGKGLRRAVATLDDSILEKSVADGIEKTE